MIPEERCDIHLRRADQVLKEAGEIIQAALRQIESNKVAAAEQLTKPPPAA